MQPPGFGNFFGNIEYFTFLPLISRVALEYARERCNALHHPLP